MKIVGNVNIDMPWQDKPEECSMPMWRYSKNPVIKRNPIPGVARIFNSAVAQYEEAYVAVLRAELIDGRPHIYIGHSKDGINWDIDKDPIQFVDDNGDDYQPLYAYDPRLVKVEDEYFIIWCGDFYGASLGMAKTKDFKTFVRLENPFLPFNRNGVLFPKKFDGEYLLLSRPSDSGHTPFGDIFVSRSKDLVYWGKHRHVMSSGGSGWWQTLKIGGGPAPIETSEGWLMFYHGVTNTCNGYVYSIGSVILDLDNPAKVKYRCKNFVMTPEEWYEERGFVPNVLFPCAVLVDGETGRIAVYYGAADTYVGLAFTTVDEIVKYTIGNSEVVGDQATEGRM